MNCIYCGSNDCSNDCRIDYEQERSDWERGFREHLARGGTDD